MYNGFLSTNIILGSMCRVSLSYYYFFNFKMKGGETMIRKMFAVVLLLVAMSTSAMADIDVSTIVISTVGYFALALIVLTALAALWPIRKMIKLSNRS